MATATKQTANPVVKISTGAHNHRITASWQKGDTVASALRRANVTIDDGYTAAIGRRRIIDPGQTDIRPGEVVVIVGALANG